MENDPQNFDTASTAPLLMIQGGADEQIPPVSTKALADHECKIGQVSRNAWIYPGQSHSGVVAPSAVDMMHWIADRFANAADPNAYVPTGQADIERMTCPSYVRALRAPRARCAAAAIDQERGAGHIAAGRAGQECDRAISSWLRPMRWRGTDSSKRERSSSTSVSAAVISLANMPGHSAFTRTP